METFRQFVDTIKSNAIVVTISLAFAGYLVAYVNARILARKKDRLALVTQRINEFYGPLYVATKAGRTAYDALVKKMGRERVFEPDGEPSQADLDEWFVWMKNVFMPLNSVREKVIIENAHLIVEDQMPECLVQFVTHVVGYKAVMAKWEKGDFTEKFSLIDFPAGLEEYVTGWYTALKLQQTRLLDRL